MGKTYGEWLNEHGHSPTTIAARTRFYRSRLTAWGSWDVPVVTLTDWLSTYSGWSRCTYHAHLTSIYDWLVDTGQRAENPMRQLRSPKKPPPRPRPLTEADLRRAFLAADTRTGTFLALGYYAGFRAFEVAKFHGRHITEETITVLGKGGVVAELPTHPILWDLAQLYPRDDYWFPSPREGYDHIGSTMVTRAVRLLFRELGLSGATHRARHSYGTSLLRGGANIRVVQELMRHSSLATTAAYLGVDEVERRTAIGSLAA